LTAPNADTYLVIVHGGSAPKRLTWRIIRRLGRRRMMPGDRARHDAFLDEVEETWQTDHYTRPTRFRAFAAHCCTRLFDGPPSLAQVAVAGLAIASGTAIQAFAPPRLCSKMTTVCRGGWR